LVGSSRRRRSGSEKRAQRREEKNKIEIGPENKYSPK
jgi:hypothetical protein